MKKFSLVLMSLLLGAVMMTGCGSAPSVSDTAGVPAETGRTEEPAETGSTEEPDELSVPASEEPDGQAASDGQDDPAEPVDVNVIALKGPTAMGMVSFMDKADAGEMADNSYHFEIAAAVDEVSPKLVQGQVDIAAVPANLASVLYNNTDGGIEVLAINTLGVIYIVESGDTVSDISDLKGKTIYASGKGATPEYALNYILTQNGINPETDVTIEWKSEHAECLAALMAQDNAIAMLPQPFVTTAQAKSDKIRVALDFTEEWDKLGTDSAFLTGVVVAGKEFADTNPEAVEAFMNHYEESVNYVNENIEEAAALIEKYDIVPAAVASKAIPECNITFITGEEMQKKLSGYLAVLLEQNPKSVGGALPEEDFYYIR